MLEGVQWSSPVQSSLVQSSPVQSSPVRISTNSGLRTVDWTIVNCKLIYTYGNNRTDLFNNMEESADVVVLLSEGEKEDDSDVVLISDDMQSEEDSDNKESILFPVSRGVGRGGSKGSDEPPFQTRI